MAFPAITLDEAIDLIIADGNTFGSVLRGDGNTTVIVEGGTIPSVIKALQDAAAYKAPIAWSEGNTETDILQLRLFNNGLYAPLSVPVLMVAAPNPDSNNWRALGIEIADAPSDGSFYSRKDGSWASDPIQADAPANGSQYARQDNGWVAISLTAGGISYVNTTSGLTATDTQAAIDEVEARVDTLEAAPAAGRTLDTAQVGELTPATTWLIDSTVVRSRALAASPADGDEVGFADEDGLSATNNATIARTGVGYTIAGAAADFLIDVNFARGVLKYNLADTDWKLVP